MHKLLGRADYMYTNISSPNMPSNLQPSEASYRAGYDAVLCLSLLRWTLVDEKGTCHEIRGLRKESHCGIAERPIDPPSAESEPKVSTRQLCETRENSSTRQNVYSPTSVSEATAGSGACLVRIDPQQLFLGLTSLCPRCLQPTCI